MKIKQKVTSIKLLIARRLPHVLCWALMISSLFLAFQITFDRQTWFNIATLCLTLGTWLIAAAWIREGHLSSAFTSGIDRGVKRGQAQVVEMVRDLEANDAAMLRRENVSWGEHPWTSSVVDGAASLSFD